MLYHIRVRLSNTFDEQFEVVFVGIIGRTNVVQAVAEFELGKIGVQ